MFELMLMRHAKSDWHSRAMEDLDRPLNKRGVEDARNMGAYLGRLGLVPDRIVVSPAQRARQTVKLLLNSLAVAKEHVIVDSKLYLADRKALQGVTEIYAVDNQRLMILAHNPGMDDLVRYLANKAPLLSASGKLMATCAVAGFRLNSLDALNKAGQGELQNLFRPGEIADVAGKCQHT